MLRSLSEQINEFGDSLHSERFKMPNFGIGRQFCCITPTPAPQLGIVGRAKSDLQSGFRKVILCFYSALNNRKKHHVYYSHNSNLFDATAKYYQTITEASNNMSAT